MKYSDILSLKLDRSNIGKSINTLKSLGINAPDKVIEQFYIDHSNNEKFLKIYGSINLKKISWGLIEVETNKIISINDSATFPDFVRDVTEDASYVEKIGIKAIDNRQYVVDQWLEFGTWVTPPVFIDGRILDIPTSDFHLVEGHNRVGCLCGINKYRPISLAKRHLVYYGQYDAKIQ